MRTRRLVTTAALLAFAALSACARHAAPSPTATRGAALFAKNCAACHGDRGAGGVVGPPLVRERKKKTLAAIVEAIKAPDPPMPKLYPAELSRQDVADIAAYLETL